MELKYQEFTSLNWILAGQILLSYIFALHQILAAFLYAK